MKKRFSDEQIISILLEVKAGISALELCRKLAISHAIFYIPGAREGHSTLREECYQAIKAD